MEKQKNAIKKYHAHVREGIVSASNYKGIANMHGITLIALVITKLVPTA